MQMLTEKLAKAFLAKGTKEPVHRHGAFVALLRTVKGNYDLMQCCGMSQKRQYQEYLRSLLPLAEKIESLAPALSNNGPNAEYPWQDGSGEICVPAEYSFENFGLRDSPKISKMTKFIESCIAYLEAS